MSNIKVSEPEWSRLVRVRDFPGVPTPTVSGVTVGWLLVSGAGGQVRSGNWRGQLGTNYRGDHRELGPANPGFVFLIGLLWASLGASSVLMTDVKMEHQR